MTYPPMPPLPPLKSRRRRGARSEPGYRESEPVFVEHEPVINHPPEAWHHTVPYPYRFKIDGAWLWILSLLCGGLFWTPMLWLAGFLAVIRVWVWLCFRFPLTMWFVLGALQGLSGRRRRW